jgi:hypothetical protein
VTEAQNHPHTARVASAITLVAGIWLFVTPFLYGAFGNGNMYNGFTIGGLIIVFSLIRLARPLHGPALSWMQVIFGVWTCLSPVIFRFGIEPRTWNNIAIGLLVIVLSVVSAHATPMEPLHPGPSRVL